MIEQHPFGNYLPKNADTLIIGSFPCFNGKDYGEWYYSASGKSEFWPLLGSVFQHPIDSFSDKKNLCDVHGIAMTDIALKVSRKKNNCSDANLKIIKFNTDGINNCLALPLKQIFFTGKFVEKQFKKIFPDVQIPTQILLSPSPASNIYIAGLEEYKSLKKENRALTPYLFRLMKYKDAFS